MLRLIPYVLAGSAFGVIMYKSEAASWYRIQEMFRFGSFHMYGIIMVAVGMGALGYLLINKFKLKDLKGQPIVIPDKAPGWKRYLLGGLIFGLGWALTGACPGPVFVNLGAGFLSMLPVAIGGILGTFLYGVFKDKMPH